MLDDDSHFSLQPLFTDVKCIVDLQVALVVIINKLKAEKTDNGGNHLEQNFKYRMFKTVKARTRL